jgi:hypothetical protein
LRQVGGYNFGQRGKTGLSPSKIYMLSMHEFIRQILKKPDHQISLNLCMIQDSTYAISTYSYHLASELRIKLDMLLKVLRFSMV